MRALVTGGAGFIGSALVRRLVGQVGTDVVTLDKLTYAGNLDSIADALDAPNHRFERVDLCDAAEVRRVVREHAPDVIFHLAAESHVDRSIDGPATFVQTNVIGTLHVLEAAREYWLDLEPADRAAFRVIHVSTDEVFGSLGAAGAFSESSPYAPSSPYSASKAGADHLARAWWHTYRLPVVVTNCSNNFGPYQFPEKLIPLMIERARARRELPVYGRGENVRDWLYVEDHVDALLLAAERGRPGETYVIGGHGERSNLDVVHAVCDLLDARLADGGPPRRSLVRFVADRPGHDFRYAIDPTKARRELGWNPTASFETNLQRTVDWYVTNATWCARVLDGTYRGERLGLSAGAREVA